MADDRPANDDLAAVVAELRRDLADLRGTALARASRLPTGSIEPTILLAPKTDTLFLQGQTLNRADYPVLWQWVVDNSLAPSVFGNGNGTTTFVLPDWRGRTGVGASAGRPVGTQFGATERVIAPANMAAHTHQVEFRDHMSGTGQTAAEVGSPKVFHGHPSTGGHGGHNNQNFSVAIGAAGSSYVLRSAAAYVEEGHHYHGNDGPPHDHYLYIPPHQKTSEVVVGSNTPLNIENPAVSVNWLLWC